MKKVLVFLVAICMATSSISVPVMADELFFDNHVIEDIVSEDVIFEETVIEEDPSDDFNNIVDFTVDEDASEELNNDVTVDDVVPEEIVIEEPTSEMVTPEENTTEPGDEETAIEETTTEVVLLEEFPAEENSIEESFSEEKTYEEETESVPVNEFAITPSYLPRYTPEIRLFTLRSPRLSDEQKAVKLRDFLLERLNNMEAYQNELTLAEDNSGAPVLYVDLSGLYDVELYYDNAANKNTAKKIMRNAINGIRDSSPRTFWCKNSYTWSWDKNDYKISTIGLILNCDKDFNVEDGLQPVIDEVNALTAELDSYVQSIVDLIPDNYSDYEKILFANDYLCTNYKYDTRYYTSNVYISNAYDFFKEGKGVCQAYTLVFMAIMDELGIRSDVVSSEAMNHIWNLVELNGKWYHVDVTWNDPCFRTLKNDTFGKSSHKYFLLSSERIENIDTYPDNHYGFDVDSYGYEFGTEFDDIEVDLNKSLISSFIELNGTWYNTGYNDAIRKCGLYAFNSPDLSSITNEDLKTPFYNIGLWRTAGTAYYPYAFSYLAKYNDTILFNTPTAICVFDGNNVAELYIPERADDERIYGFTVKDNTMYMQLATDPNDGMENATLIKADIVNVVYKDYDGTILSEGFAAEGEDTPDLFMPDTPVRNISAYYDYTFEKWATEDDCTFVAQYTKTLKEGITLPGQEGITISSIPSDKVYGDEGFKIDVSTTETTPNLGAFEFANVDEDGNLAETSTVATVDAEGNVTIKGAGTTYIKIFRAGNEDYTDFEQIETLVVAPKEILVTPTSGLSKYEGQEDAELTYTFEENQFVDADKDVISGALARVEGEEPGTYNITLGTLKINDNYKLILPETAVTFEIKAKLNQDVTVSEIGNVNLCYGDTLTFTVEQTNPDVMNNFVFSSNNEEVATVDVEGKIMFVGVGEVKITISNAGNDKYNNYEKVFTFNVSKREITLSAFNFDEKTATFTNGLEADVLNLDFNKVIFEVMGVCEEDDTKSNVKVANLLLTGEKAEYYTLTTEQFDYTVANTNVIEVNPKAENGSISGVGKYLVNVEVTLIATANSNYKFDGWYKNGSCISTSATYTFNTSKLEGVEAKFSQKQKPVNAGGGGGGFASGGGITTTPSTNAATTENTPVEWNNPFSDVNKNAWYYADVKNIIEKKLMTGTVNNKFSPDEATTRGMIVTILYRLEGEPFVDVKNGFDDVNNSAYYGKAVEWAAENGIVGGVGEGKFAPNEEITREQFATILYRYANFKGMNVTSKAKLDNFSDNNEISTWATDAIAWANASGIITGTSATTISPKNGAVRAQAAAMFNRFINLNK